MAKGSPRSAARRAAGQRAGGGALQRIVVPFNNLAIALVDTAGVVARLSRQIHTFPQGLVVILGASIDLTITKSSAGVNADWDGDISLGTVACAGDATLTSTEANIIASTATPQAVAGATTGDAVSTAGATINGTSTAAAVFLNILVDDTDHDVTSTPCNLVLNGSVTILAALSGDV